jgi:hypothetical protein
VPETTDQRRTHIPHSYLSWSDEQRNQYWRARRVLRRARAMQASGVPVPGAETMERLAGLLCEGVSQVDQHSRAVELVAPSTGSGVQRHTLDR